METELKNIIYELLFDAFEQSKYDALITIEMTVKENEFLGICREKTLSNLYEEHTAEIKNSNFVLDYLIRTFKFMPILPNNERTEENYIDFLAYAMTPFYEKTNETELQSKEYTQLDYEQKYMLWKDILFNNFVESFESYEIIEFLNKQKSNKSESLTGNPDQNTIPENILSELENEGLITKEPLKWIGAINLCAYFVDCYFNKKANLWAIGEKIFNVKNLAQQKDNYMRYNKTGKPKKYQIIDRILSANN